MNMAPTLFQKFQSASGDNASPSSLSIDPWKFMTWTLTRELAYVCSVGVTLFRLHIYVKLQNMKRNYIINFCDRREMQTEELGVHFPGTNQCQQAYKKSQRSTWDRRNHDGRWNLEVNEVNITCQEVTAAVHDEEMTQNRPTASAFNMKCQNRKRRMSVFWLKQIMLLQYNIIQG